MSTLFILIIAFLVIAFTWLVWMRQGLVYLLRDVSTQHQQWQEQLNKRRDQVPALLEAVRKAKEPDHAWRKLLKSRAEFHAGPLPMEAEAAFERELHQYLLAVHVNRIDVLEAKKNITDLSNAIYELKKARHLAVQRYHVRIQTPPHRWAAQLFGFTHFD